MKVAKLIKVEFTTRVIVDSEDEDFTICEKAKKNLAYLVANGEAIDNLVSIEDDTEIPFGELKEDVYYRPVINGFNSVDGHPGVSIDQNVVWSKKEALLSTYPKCMPIKLAGDDIRDKRFID